MNLIVLMYLKENIIHLCSSYRAAPASRSAPLSTSSSSPARSATDQHWRGPHTCLKDRYFPTEQKQQISGVKAYNLRILFSWCTSLKHQLIWTRDSSIILIRAVAIHRFYSTIRFFFLIFDFILLTSTNRQNNGSGTFSQTRIHKAHH